MSSASTAAKSASGSASSLVTTPTVDRSVLAEQYGFTEAFMNAYPEIGSLIDQAVREGWTPDMFQARLKNTNYWKNTNDAQRKAALLWTSDPAEYGSQWNKAQNHVIALLGAAGSLGESYDWDLINKLAGRIVNEGWNDERLNQEIGQHVVFGSGGMAYGHAGEIQQELNSYAYSMGVKNADSWIQNAVRSVVSGRSSMQDFKNQIRDQSIAAFPGYEDQLKSGQTMYDIAQPYMQSMSSILELAPGEVNLFDPTIRDAFNYKDSTGKATTKPLWQFQNDLRSDERWKSTKNAQDATMGVAHSILQQFGFYS